MFLVFCTDVFTKYIDYVMIILLLVHLIIPCFIELSYRKWLRSSGKSEDDPVCCGNLQAVRIDMNEAPQSVPMISPGEPIESPPVYTTR